MSNPSNTRKWMPVMSFEDHERFLKFITVNFNSGCWIWNGGINDGGYGNFWLNGKTYRAHRVSYSIFIRDPSLFGVLDHICRNRACVNPWHARDVSVLKNCTENSTGFASVNRFKVKCVNGHEFNKENTGYRNGGRDCRACRRNRVLAKRERRKNEKLHIK